MSELKPCPITEERAIEQIKRCYAACGMMNSENKEFIDFVIDAIRRAQPTNEPLTCVGCDNEKSSPKNSAFSYEACIRCRRHWPDRYRTKPEGAAP